MTVNKLPVKVALLTRPLSVSSIAGREAFQALARSLVTSNLLHNPVQFYLIPIRIVIPENNGDSKLLLLTSNEQIGRAHV